METGHSVIAADIYAVTEPGNLARHAYTQELEELEHDLLEMAANTESMLSRAVESLCQLNHVEALKVLDDDDVIDQEDIEIEGRCLRLLALQQPIATDFRTIGTAMRMIVDIERVGDLAVDIAKCGMKIDKEMGSADYIDVRQIAEAARKMFRESMSAFVKRDVEAIAEIVRLENEVDDLYRDLRAQIHDHMRSYPDDVVAASWLLLAVHHIERVADHAVNIAERVIYMVTGKLEQLKSAEPT